MLPNKITDLSSLSNSGEAGSPKLNRAIAKDGRQFFRTRESLDAPTFVGYLKEM